ncbi:MAG: type II CRISPR-associated endonuclease Cas1 [Clostridia bacterium]|nr:type II CRISPR-associated endonuclease Cas1 [Clostridia bacterium]
MGWRVVVIKSKAKLDYKMDYLTVRTEEKTSRIHIDEISVLLIESTSVSLTAYLIAELAKKKVKVIFCDEKSNPVSELYSIYGSHDTSRKIREQIKWNEETKKLVWAEIVRLKISGQLSNLPKTKKEEAELLLSYISQIEPGDPSNREGHSAKVYFNALFGKDFSRSDENAINASLNYGYSIILSAINREIVSHGYLTQLGIFHNNMFNQFNLSCDFMEPFRPLVDKLVVTINPTKLEHEEKMKIVDILNQKIRIGNQQHYISSAIHIYIQSLLDALLENDVSKIKNIDYEL